MSGPGDEWSYTATDTSGGELAFNRETLEELFKRLNAQANDGHAVTESERLALHKAFTEYLEWRKNQPPTGTPPQALPVPKKAVPKPAPPNIKPPVQDSAEDLAAPDVQPPAAPPKTVTLDRQPPTEQIKVADVVDYHWGRISKNVDDIAARVTPQPATEADLATLLRNLARNESPLPGEPHPTHADPFARTPATVGDPVDLFSGAFSIAVADLAVTSAGAEIRMERFYRSGRPYYGPFGYGWDHVHNVYLRPLNSGALALWTGQLREQTFYPDGSGWQPEHGLAARIERKGVDVFDVIHPQGLRWHFERPVGWGSVERIPLAAIVDRFGNAVHYTYDALDRVASALDGAGRGLRFAYGQCGLLERVSDHTGTRMIRYDHHVEIEHLERVTLPATRAFPNGQATTYVYDLDADHPAMRHNILRVIDASGRTYLENTYATPDAGWSFNTLTRQLMGGFEYVFTYEAIQFVPMDPIYLDILATRTTVGKPDGSLHVYTFNYRGDLLDHRFRLSRDRSYRVIAAQFAYDAAGNVTESVDPDGVRQVLTYDAANSDPCARRNLLRIDIAAPVAGGPSRMLLHAKFDTHFQLPLRVFDEGGHVTRFVYDFDIGDPGATGRPVRIEFAPVTLADGSAQQSVVHMEHNARGQMTALTDPNGVRTEYEFVSGGIHDGFLRRVIRDAAAIRHTTELTYDANGFVSSSTATGARTSLTRYNAIGQIEDTTPPKVDGFSEPTRRWFGDNGALVRIERPLGAFHDAVITDPFIADVVERDVLGRVLATRLAANTALPSVTKQRCDHDGRPVSSTDAAGIVTEYRYDERGALLRTTVGIGLPEQLTTHYGYDRGGRQIRLVDALGRTTEVTRDLWGRPKEVHLPGAAIRHLEWGDGDLLLASWIEGSPGPGLPARRLRWESYEYDQRGRIRAENRWCFTDDHTTALPLTTRYLLDGGDLLREVLQPRGGVVRYERDALGRVVRITEVSGATKEFIYDAAGDLIEERNTEVDHGLGHQASILHTYDARGRRRSSEGRGTRIEIYYDQRNRIVEHRGSGNVVIRFERGARGEVTRRVADAGGLAVDSSWTYDPAGRMRRYVDPLGAVTEWTFDALGRPSMMSLPDGSLWKHSFDVSAREHIRITPSGVRVTTENDAYHDAPRRLACLAPPGIEPVPDHTFEYDGLGRMIKASVPAGAVERHYDSLGRLVQESIRGQGLGLAYDDKNGAIDLKFPDGRVERTTVDLAGRPVSVTLTATGVLGGSAGTVLAQIDYGTARHPLGIVHGNGVRTAIAYDDPGRVIRIEHVHAGAVLDSYRTRLDVRGRRAVVQYTGLPARTTLHQYDGTDRLRLAVWGFVLPDLPDVASAAEHLPAIVSATIASASATASETYQLDHADGRLQRVRTGAGAATVAYGLGPDHRIVQAGAQPITYHQDGHRAADAEHQYDVDALGRIARVRNRTNGAVEAEFHYDPLSRVGSGSLAGAPFARWFLGATWVHEERGASAETRQASPHPLWPQPLCVSSVGSQLFIHPDGALSTLCVTDASGQVRERHRFGPFGAPEVYASDGLTSISAATAAVEPMWRGMPLLAATGLYATPQRLYDPEHGTFLARDPLLFADSASPYVYASHNPVDFADPAGLAKTPVAPANAPAGTPLPPVSGPNDRLLIPHGVLWQQYEAGLKDAWNPDNPIWARALLGGLSILAAPVAGLEEYVGRAILNVPYLVDNAGTSAGEHAARGYLLRDQAEHGESSDPTAAAEGLGEYFEGIASFALGFLTVATLVEPKGPASNGPVPETGPPARSANRSGLERVTDSLRALHQDTRGGLQIPGTKLPEFVVDYAEHPELAANMWHALQAKYPPELTYAGDKVFAALNRANATRNVPRLLSRDEYPFASTLEGGSSTWVGHIPASQNSAQGGLLGAFYKRYGLRAGDRFTVSVVNHPGLP